MSVMFTHTHSGAYLGKSGFVGRRFAGSLGSIGLPAHFIHATEFVHGDLGKSYVFHHVQQQCLAHMYLHWTS